MGWLLCRLGRHAWRHQRSPDVSGAGAHYEVCTRCNKEKKTYGKPPWTGLIGAG